MKLTIDPAGPDITILDVAQECTQGDIFENAMTIARINGVAQAPYGVDNATQRHLTGANPMRELYFGGDMLNPKWLAIDVASHNGLNPPVTILTTLESLGIGGTPTAPPVIPPVVPPVAPPAPAPVGVTRIAIPAGATYIEIG